MKKIFTVLLLSALLLTACQSTKKQPEKELTFGILPAESAIPIILAKEKGFFEDEGLNVTIKSFSSPNDRNVAVQAKELDGVIGDVMTEAAFYENGLKLKITSDINEDFKILSSPDSGITDMKGLDGKKVSLVPNFILEYIMDKFAEENGFTYEIVEIPSFSGRSEALLSNQVDGVVFTEPQAGMLAAQGAHLLGSSRDAGIKGGALLFTETALTEKPDSVKAFYKAYNKAVEYMNTTKVSEFVSILTDYQFPEAIGTYLSNLKKAYEPAGTIDKSQFEDIIKWTKEKGQITKDYTYEELTDFSFLPQ
ncbi:ABC transporter substrate-binding protein [Anaerocolumna xylanovorans]|uniref:NitT/TauT family transport system substrate-binding protein n=1 Tax=Anaerocolumna xylanovorans DSM 12503 TaxID=1121345 RepID=A0A1M7YJC7_9FIRM|nr:ABC transporter substrate-binding protein [Anaerocolumna xylanovorans]SHO52714.1 NitT/TauT family transport system substrate-binding protein [Anaerocolumna xylanovorans DSM 12503]